MGQETYGYFFLTPFDSPINNSAVPRFYTIQQRKLKTCYSENALLVKTPTKK